MTISNIEMTGANGTSMSKVIRLQVPQTPQVFPECVPKGVTVATKRDGMAGV